MDSATGNIPSADWPKCSHYILSALRTISLKMPYITSLLRANLQVLHQKMTLNLLTLEEWKKTDLEKYIEKSWYGKTACFVYGEEEYKQWVTKIVRIRGLSLWNTDPFGASQSYPQIWGYRLWHALWIGVSAPSPPFIMQSLDMALGICKHAIESTCHEKQKNFQWK